MSSHRGPMKRSIDDLAVFGSTAAFQDTVCVGRPRVHDRTLFLDKVDEILQRNWLTNNGPCVQEFESELQEALGVRHCIATCNGTLALCLTVKALDLKGEAIVPSFTFIATAHALLWQGITPVFCDINPDNHTLDPKLVEKSITNKTTAILATHLWGNPCEIESLERIASRHELKLIFDAAHAFGSRYDGKLIGSFGDAEVFSFHATKFINALEGGAIATNNDELADRLRLMRNFGFAGYDHIVTLGINAKMNEISAAMGLVNLLDWQGVVELNRRNHSLYQKALAGVPGIELASYQGPGQANYQYCLIEIDESQTGISRDELMRTLAYENIMARRYFYPGCHHCEPYRSSGNGVKYRLPVTEQLAEMVLCLPTGISTTDEAIEKIVEVIRLTVSKADQVRERLTACK